MYTAPYVIKFSKPVTSATFILYIAYFTALHALGRDWLSMRSAVAGATFMNEFAPYAMQAPPFKRRTRQRFTEIDYRSPTVDII